MLTYDLKPILKMRGIERPHNFLVKAGISRHTASRILDGECETIRARHIELLCTALLCEPNDLFVWVPDKNVTYPEDFPLKKLEKKEIGENLFDALSQMPLDKFKEVAKMVLGTNDE